MTLFPSGGRAPTTARSPWKHRSTIIRVRRTWYVEVTTTTESQPRSFASWAIQRASPWVL